MNNAPASPSTSGLGAAAKFGARWRARLSVPPNQIAIGQSVRAVLALSVPLALLRWADLPVAGLLFFIGALQVILADGAGPYRDRLLGILVVCLSVPEIYWLGTQATSPWWIASGLIFLIAFAGGLLRAIGPRGATLGLVTSVSFLLGTLTVASSGVAAVHAGWVFAGCVWALLLALAAWRLRPYLALQRETGAALDAAARMLAAVSGGHGDLRTQERDTRAAVENARNALDATRAMVPANNKTLVHLFAVMRIASRLAVFASGLAEIRARLADDETLRAALDATVAALARNARAASRALIDSRAWHPDPEFDAARTRLHECAASRPAADQTQAAALSVLDKSTLYVNELQDVCAFFASAHGRHDHWLPRLALRERLKEMAVTVGHQFSWHTTLFRHALRLGIVTALATGIELFWHFPHGMWLPMTALVVMQPDFGATRGRALIRAAGTLAGVLVAAAILSLTDSPMIWQIALAVLVFLTAFAVRISYGFFVACLTPMVIILLALQAPGQGWHFALQRIEETLGGIALAIAGALVLWPDWIRHRLPATFARSITATGRYLETVFDAAAKGSGLTPEVIASRRNAERALADSELAFQTLLAEPGHRAQRPRYRHLELQLSRLSRHLGALAARLDAGLPAVPVMSGLGAAEARRLATIADNLGTGADRQPVETAPAMSIDISPEDVHELVVAVDDAVSEVLATRNMPILR